MTIYVLLDDLLTNLMNMQKPTFIRYHRLYFISCKAWPDCK